MINIILIIAGFALLIKGADWFIEGATSLAKKLGVSALVIGLSVVALGTSAPELAVNLLAALQGNADIALSNVIGSNIINTLLILGIAASIYPLTIRKDTVWKEIPFSILAGIVLFILVNDGLINGGGPSALTRSDGAILILFFAIFLYYVVSMAKNETIKVREEKDIVELSSARTFMLIVIGLAGLVAGGKSVVVGAIEFAKALGVAETLIGLTIVAIGTSLPELMTSAVAAYRKNVDIAVGNIIGSNMFNIFLVLGATSLTVNIPFNSSLNPDIMIVIGSSVFLFLLMFIGKRHELKKWGGLFFVLLYIAYILYLISL